MSQCTHKKSSRKKRFLATLLIVFGLFGGVATVFAAGKAARFFFMYREITGIVKQMNLTPDQKSRLRTVFKNARADRKENKALFKQYRNKVITLLKQDKPNEKELKDTIGKAFDKAKSITLNKTDYLLKAHAILTREQKQLLVRRLEALHTKIKAKRKKSRRYRRFKKMHDDPNYVPRFLR